MLALVATMLRGIGMIQNKSFLHAGLDAITRRRYTVNTFRAAFSEQLLEGLVSKDYAVVMPDQSISITVPGAKALLEMEGVDVNARLR